MVDKMKKTDFNGVIFELPERYEAIKVIGKGTYGAVVSAVDHLTNEKVAIKKLSKIEDMVKCLMRVTYFLDRCKKSFKRNQNNEEFDSRKHTGTQRCGLYSSCRVS